MQGAVKMNAYHAFIKVIETGNFTKAAEELGYTQSAISQMVNSLEKELSTILILRSRTGITLTPDARSSCRIYGISVFLIWSCWRSRMR